MHRHLLDDMDESERYEEDGCMNDMERFNRHREMEEEMEFFAFGTEDEEVNDLLADFDDEIEYAEIEDDEIEDDD